MQTDQTKHTFEKGNIKYLQIKYFFTKQIMSFADGNDPNMVFINFEITVSN